MRRILVDFARARHNVKRGGEVHPISLDEAPDIAQGGDVSLVALDDALNSLAAIDPRKSKVVELRFFGRAVASRKRLKYCEFRRTRSCATGV